MKLVAISSSMQFHASIVKFPSNALYNNEIMIFRRENDGSLYFNRLTILNG